ncbi:MAG: AAA family ATPase [Desulfovibrio sp.]|jgi:SpoVK/Ycf46/Vps4 family AAA+-type ATPase|nr:AAA family ATPase [Desulfovibrio sp.]
MRHRHHKIGGSTIAAVTPETSYAQGKCAGWLLRLMEQGVELDDDFFTCFGWAIGGLSPFLKSLSGEIKNLPEKRSVSAFKKAVNEAIKSPEYHQDDKCEELVREHPAMKGIIAEMLRRECVAAAADAAKNDDIWRTARKRLKRMFGISDALLQLCDFVFIQQSFSEVENYIEDHLELYKYQNRRILAHLLDFDYKTLLNCIAEAHTCGFFDDYSCHNRFRLRDELLSFWVEDETSDKRKLFYKSLDGKKLPLEKFRVSREDIDHVMSLLEHTGHDPVHILLYGPPGTGKTTFANSLADALKVKAWSVVSRADDDDAARRTSLCACLNLATKHSGAFVLVDEAERLLDTNNLFTENSKDKAWLNAFLEERGRRVIWITNHVTHVEQAVRRRFTYSIHFDRLGKKERGEIWRQVIRDQRMENSLSEEQVQNLVRNYDVPAAVIEKSVCQVKRLHVKKKDCASAVERVLCAHVTLSRDGRKPRKKPEVNDDYTLEGVCMANSAQELLDKCRRVDTLLRNEKSLRPGGGTMLFYGPPGTGKTALARHIAKELDRECMVKRASDLLSMWVGESEQQVAEAFRKSEADGSVLVIDEADSFIYSRDIAQRSWETTLVNEFLTCLEECRGFCVCTTNRRDNMDAAAMRRFSFKVEFTYAKPEQIRALYASLLAPLAGRDLHPEEEKILCSMTRLTPGDFHAVRSQYWLEEPASVDIPELLERLKHEQNIKLDKNQSRIGF